MSPAMLLDLLREAFFLIVTLVVVIISPSLFVGLIVSTFQAATQINEQTLSFLPRLIVTILLLIFAGPWIMQKLVDLTNRLFTNIPYLIS